VAGNARCQPLGDVVGTLELLIGYSSDPGGNRSKSLSVRKSFPCLELLERPSISHL
jgi:hypothetical protein